MSGTTPIYNNLDLKKNQIKNVAIDNQSTFPSSPSLGQMFFNTGDNCFYGWNGTLWINLTNKSYVHNQISASNQWTVNHNLGFKPAGIIVYDSANSFWVCEVEYVNNNTCILHFGNVSFGGTAYLS